MPMKKFNHAVTLSLEVASDHEQPTIREVIFGLHRKLAMYYNDNIEAMLEHVEVFSSYEFDSEEEYQRWLELK